MGSFRGAAKAANPEPMNTGLWNIDSGFAASRRLGMTIFVQSRGGSETAGDSEELADLVRVLVAGTALDPG
jgi:hypothetical protein